MAKKVKVKPLADRLLVRRIEEDVTKVGNLYIPDTAKERPLLAEVVEVGPGRLNEEGKRIPMEVSAGQRILIGKYAGTDVKLEGRRISMRPGEIEASKPLGYATYQTSAVVRSLQLLPIK